MSTEVSLYGLASGGMIQLFPRIAAAQPNMGLGGLANTLDYLARHWPGLLEEYTDDPTPGLRQYQVLDVGAFIEHTRENKEEWDSVGLGFSACLERMQQKPDLAWWFHCYS